MAFFTPEELNTIRSAGLPDLVRPQVPVKKKGFWQDQISTGGGIAGSLGGAAAGGAIGAGFGGVGAVPGALIGAILGGFGGGAGGQAVENAVVGDDLGKDVLKEGALNALFSVGPVRGLNVAAQGTRALLQGAGKAGLRDAVEQATTATPIRNAIFGQGSSKLANVGADLRRGVANTTKVADSYTQEMNILDSLNRNGLRGSATRQYKNVDQTLGNISGEIQNTLGNITTSAPRKAVLSTLEKNAADVLPSDSTYTKELTRSLERLSKSGSGNVTPQELFAFKQELGNRLGNAFNKINKGNALTPKEEVDMALWKNLDDEITKLAPDVKQMTLDQSNLITARPGLQAASQKTAGVPLLGVKSRSLEQASQFGRDMTGRGIGKLAGAGTGRPPVNPLNPIRMGGRMAVGDNLVNAMLFGHGAPDMQNDQNQQGVNEADQTSLYSDPSLTAPQEPTNPFGISQQEVAQNMLQALAKGDSKGFAQLKAVYDLIGQSEATGSNDPGYTKPTAGQFAQATTAIKSVQQLEQLLSGNSDLVNRNATPGQDLPLIGSTISNAVGTGQYRALAKNILNSIARINTGANMPASEQKFYEQTYLPQPNDSPETQQTKIANLYQFFVPIADYRGGSGSQTVTQDDLYNALNGN